MVQMTEVTKTSSCGLVVQSVSHYYKGAPQKILDDISLSVAAGEMLCLVGPSGCGKSTLLRLIAGLEPLQVGSITLDEKMMANANYCVPTEKRGVGLVFQDYALFPHMNVLQNVEFGLINLSSQERKAKAQAMLKRVGLIDRASDFPHQLSGGQQQRVAVARALATGPKIVLLDEPFSNLDVRLRQKMRQETMQLLKQTQTPSIMVTHDPYEAMFMGDRIVLMDQGNIVQVGTPQELYNYPINAFAAAFFGEINQFKGIVEKGTVHTLIGTISAQGFEEGTSVEVLIRPQALNIHTQLSQVGTRNTAKGVVQNIRLLGTMTIVDVSLNADKTAGPNMIQVLTSGVCKVNKDQAIELELVENKGIFIFNSI